MEPVPLEIDLPQFTYLTFASPVTSTYCKVKIAVDRCLFFVVSRVMSLLTFWMWTKILLWSVIVPVILRLVEIEILPKSALRRTTLFLQC